MGLDLSLYLVTDPVLNGGRSLTDLVYKAVKGGVSIVQLRDPIAKTRSLIEQAQALQALLRPQNIPLIINDRVDVALAVGAAGVHLGQKDMDARQARALLGADAIIGLSIGSEAEWLASQEAISAVDYIGTGPVFATSTKGDAGDAIGYDGLAGMRARTRLPMVAIGGVKREHVGGCLKAGADGVAVVSAITLAEDVELAARGFVEAIGQTRGT
jgi:thiamine-phosphate pyrophosphorylase